MTPRTDTTTLINALRILARDIDCEDGVATACISEAADRLEEMSKDLASMTQKLVDRFYEDCDAGKQP